MGKQKDMSLYTQIGNMLFNLNFFKKHQTPGPCGCINWTAGKHRQGYGMTGGIYADTHKRFMTVTHRVAMMIKLGRELKRNEFVVHTCPEFNPLCVNPDHLILGDAHVRARVMIDRDRQGIKKGMNRPSPIRKQRREYRHTEEEIRFMRTAKNKEIAKRFNTTVERAGGMKWGAIKGYKWLDNPNRLPDKEKK